MGIAGSSCYRPRWHVCRALPTLKESPREKMPFSISCGRRTGRRSRADFGVVSVCATWALLMR